MYVSSNKPSNKPTLLESVRVSENPSLKPFRIPTFSPAKDHLISISFSQPSLLPTKSSYYPSALPSVELLITGFKIELNNVAIQSKDTETLESIADVFLNLFQTSGSVSVVDVNAYVDDTFVENRYLQDVSTNIVIEIIGRPKNTQSSGFVSSVENIVSSNDDTLLTSLRTVMPKLSGMNVSGVRTERPSYIPSSTRQPSEEPSESQSPTVISEQVLSAVVGGAAVSVEYYWIL